MTELICQYLLNTNYASLYIRWWVYNSEKTQNSCPHESYSLCSKNIKANLYNRNFATAATSVSCDLPFDHL